MSGRACGEIATDVASLRSALHELGFDEVRFARAQSVTGTSFVDWLAAGHQADMAWLERGVEKRLDPREVLAGAQSIIVLGVNYLPEAAPARAQQRWAKYSLYTDYHDTILAGLRAAGSLIESRLQLGRDDYRVYVDTGPVLERGWAVRAGVGWQGKNAMLISRSHGNWLFLATILVRATLPADQPLMNRATPAAAEEVGLFCGSCTRCLTACPTAAFPKPGWVDARRCISYQTIENRGIIPKELRASFGGRIFGCDVCLDVCPWNRFARAGRSTLLSARQEIAGVSLPELLGMNEERFRELFRRTPMKRSKLTGLLRNACIAAGNWDHSTDWHFGAGADRESIVSAVDLLCRHESEVVRAHAVWALFRLLGVNQAAARTAAWRTHETSAVVRDEYAAWLHEPGETDATA